MLTAGGRRAGGHQAVSTAQVGAVLGGDFFTSSTGFLILHLRCGGRGDLDVGLLRKLGQRETGL